MNSYKLKVIDSNFNIAYHKSNNKINAMKRRVVKRECLKRTRVGES